MKGERMHAQIPRPVVAIASLIAALLLNACTIHAPDIRFEQTSLGWHVDAVSPASPPSTSDDTHSTTLLPPGWKVTGTARTSVGIADRQLFIPFHIAKHENASGIIYVNAKYPDSMFGWKPLVAEDTEPDPPSPNQTTKPTLPSPRRGISPPPCVIVTTGPGPGKEPQVLGQGIWIGNRVLTAHHVVESLENHGAHLGINDRYQSHRFIATGKAGAQAAYSRQDLHEILAHFRSDWALLEIDASSPREMCESLANWTDVQRGQYVHMVGYDPRVPGGELTSRRMRVITTSEGRDGERSYLLENKGPPGETGWSGSFLGRLRSSGEWEFVAVMTGAIEPGGTQYPIATRPPDHILEQFFNPSAGEQSATTHTITRPHESPPP